MYGGIVGIGYEFRPEPKSFGAGVDGGSDLEAFVLIEQDSIEDVRLAGPVFAYYGNDGDMFVLVGLFKPLDSCRVDYDAWFESDVRLLASKEMSWMGFMRGN